jgi:hypothetical protein
MNTTAQALANEFASKTRDNGEFLVYATTERAQELARAAHDAFGVFILPDDWIYSVVRDAVHALAAGDEPDTEPDYMNYALLQWAADHLHMLEYCDEAITELGAQFVIEAIAYGQSAAIAIINNAVSEWIDAYDEENQPIDD